MSSHVGEERLKEERDLIYQRQKHCWPAPPVEELSLSHVWNIQKGLHVSHTSSSLPGRCLVFNGMCSFILRSGFDSCGDSNTAFVLQGIASQVRDHGHSCRHVNVLWTLKCLFCSNNNLCSMLQPTPRTQSPDPATGCGTGCPFPARRSVNGIDRDFGESA